MKKTIALIGTSALLLFLGLATPPSHAQEQHDDQGKPEAAPPKTPNDKPKPAKEKPAKPSKDQPKAEQPKTEKQPQQAEKQNEKQPKDQEKTQKEQQQSVKKSNEEQRQYAQQQNGHEGAEQSNGGGRGRIPDDRFKAHFGREHHFHIGHPEVVAGRPQFAYGGYTFIIVQAWPADWGYDDDVYVIDDGGVYYLCDVAHPGVQLALTVVL